MRDTSIHDNKSDGVYAYPDHQGNITFKNVDLIGNKRTGLMVAPPAGGNARVTLKNVDVEHNLCGVVATSHSAVAESSGTCNTALSGSAGAATISTLGLLTISDNSKIGVLSNGPFAVNRLANNKIFANTDGTKSLDSGAIISYGDNVNTGNTNNGTPTNTAGFW